MTVTYTPEVAKARKTLNEADFVGPHSAIARDAVRHLLADHARIAEENAKLGTIIDRQARKIAKLGERLHQHRVKLAKVQNEAAQHYSARARLLEENEKLRRALENARYLFDRIHYHTLDPWCGMESREEIREKAAQGHDAALAALEVQNG